LLTTLDQLLHSPSYMMDRLFWPLWTAVVIALAYVAIRTQRNWVSNEPVA